MVLTNLSFDNFIITLFFGFSGFALASGGWNFFEIIMNEIDKENYFSQNFNSITQDKENQVSYIDNCEVSVVENDELVKITGECVITKKQHTVTLPLNEYLNFHIRKQSAQVAMPSVSVEDREFLISGVTQGHAVKPLVSPMADCNNITKVEPQTPIDKNEIS